MKINAHAVSLDGIQFRSKMEKHVYVRLRIEKFPCEYEPEKITLLEGFKFCGKSYLGITYTPDFVTHTRSGRKVYIEVKGYANETFPIRRKLFLHKLLKDRSDALFFMVTNDDTLSDLMCVLREEERKKLKIAKSRKPLPLMNEEGHGRGQGEGNKKKH